jgi:hypothetical protein
VVGFRDEDFEVAATFRERIAQREGQTMDFKSATILMRIKFVTVAKEDSATLLVVSFFGIL